MSLSLLQAARIIKSGGMVVYPTETLYALGCHAAHAGAVDAVFRAKHREAAKLFPLVIGSWEQFDRFVQPDAVVRSMLERFWPGPLSVLITMREEISSRLKDTQGRTALRFTPHPLAAELCRLADSPLVATSANESGKPAPARLEELDPALREKVNGVVENGPFPKGGDPSTLIEVLGPTSIRILRPGSITASRFAEYGITVEETVNPKDC